MKSIGATTLAVIVLAIHGVGNAQGIPPNQARADADLNRQRAESKAIQSRNEKADLDERSLFEARKREYEKEERRQAEREKSADLKGAGQRERPGVRPQN